ncbi:Uncharacterised protein [Klebsiella pneumoniae]|nr:Uncharacterised protein [Klebsiella pneumoniae]
MTIADFMQGQRGGAANGKIVRRRRPAQPLLLEARVGKLNGVLGQCEEQIASREVFQLAAQLRKLTSRGKFNERKAPGHAPQRAQAAD